MNNTNNVNFNGIFIQEKLNALDNQTQLITLQFSFPHRFLSNLLFLIFSSPIHFILEPSSYQNSSSYFSHPPTTLSNTSFIIILSTKAKFHLIRAHETIHNRSSWSISKEPNNKKRSDEVNSIRGLRP